MTATLDLDEIEKRAAAATRGPWAVSDSHGLCVGNGATMIVDLEPDSTPTHWIGRREDAEFCAHAREDVPALAARVRELQAERDMYHAELAGQTGENHEQAAAYSRLVSDRDAWKERAEAAEAQLPEDTKHCTIVFKACAEGHGRLTATNWVQHGCPTCERDDLRAKLAAAEARVAEQERGMLHRAMTLTRLADERKEAIARAEKAEAAAGQMRACLGEAIGYLCDEIEDPDGSLWVQRSEQLRKSATAALQTFAGHGWVSPEVHANVRTTLEAATALIEALEADNALIRRDEAPVLERLARAEQAVGLATTAVPSMVMDPGDLVGMMQKVVAHVQQTERSRDGWRADAELQHGNRDFWKAKYDAAVTISTVQARHIRAMKERLEQAMTLLVRAKLAAAAAIVPAQRRDDDVDAARALIGDILDYQRAALVSPTMPWSHAQGEDGLWRCVSCGSNAIPHHCKAVPG